MGKINLRHFLVTNVAGGDGPSPKTSPKNVRYFNYEKADQPTAFFGLLIFPAAFSATGLLEKLLDELKTEFDTASTFDEMIFEKMIGFFNNKLGLYASAHKNQKDLAQFDICLGATFGAKLIIAPLGNISAVLFIAEPGASRYYNLLKEAKGVKPNEELLKLKEIITGNLTKNNSLIICNAELLDIYSFADLEKLLAGATAHLATANIQTALLNEKIKGTFAGFVLETLKNIEPALKNSSSSMKEMISKRQETEKIIQAAAPIDIKRAGLRAKVRLAAGGWRLAAYLWRRLWPVARLIHLFLIAMTNWNNRGQDNWEDIAIYLRQGYESFLTRLKQMPWKYKIISALAIVLLLFFGGSIAKIALQNKTVLKASRFKAAMEKINNFRTDAEVAFIQANNKEQSRQLLEAASREALKIKTQNPAELAELKEIQEQIQNRLFSLWKLQSAELPKAIATLGSILPNEKIVNAFSPDGKKIFAWSKGQIFVAQDGAVTASFQTDEELQNEFNFDNGVLSVKTKNQNRLVQLSASEQKIYTAEIEALKGNLINFIILNDKLYALQNENLFITKHAKSLTGYARGAAWLKEPIKVNDAISITIDGSLYTTNPSGEIKKMYNGRLAEFTQEKPEPKITSVNKIWTSENTRLLFMANIPDARLIIYDKRGAVISQLRFSNISAIKDFFVNDTTRIPSVSIFDGTSVYYLDLAPYL